MVKAKHTDPRYSVKYSTDLVLAASFEVFDAQGYVREDLVENENVIQYSNKKLILDLLEENNLEPATELRQDILGRLSWLMLKRPLTSFQEVMIENLKQDYAIYNQFGVFSYIPEWYHKSLKREVVDAKIYSLDSAKHVGIVGQRADLDLTVIDCRPLFGKEGLFACYSQTPDNALVFFFAKQVYEPNTRILLSAYINEHNKDLQYNMTKTHINRLKIREIINENNTENHS